MRAGVADRAVAPEGQARNILAGAIGAPGESGARLHLMNRATGASAGAELRAAVCTHLAAMPGIDPSRYSSTSATTAAMGQLISVGQRSGVDVQVQVKQGIPFMTLLHPGIVAVQPDGSRAGAFRACAAIRAGPECDLPPIQGLDVPDSSA